MKLTHALVGICLGCCAGGLMAQPMETVQQSTLRSYQATVTLKDARNNTRTLQDYCQARTTAEATRIFAARYPHARVTGVREMTS